MINILCLNFFLYQTETKTKLKLKNNINWFTLKFLTIKLALQYILFVFFMNDVTCNLD